MIFFFLIKKIIIFLLIYFFMQIYNLFSYYQGLELFYFIFNYAFIVNKNIK